MSEKTYCVVLTTFADPEVGRTIIEGLIRERLAACVQTMPVTSCYRWKGAVHNEQEMLAIIKTRTSLYPEVEAFIREHHDYECPEIVRLDIDAGFSGYLSWIGAECR